MTWIDSVGIWALAILFYSVHLGRTTMECSWSPLSSLGRRAGARSSGMCTPARLACCLRWGGLALPTCCPRSWPETQQFPQEWIMNKKTNNSYLRRFRLPPQLSWPVSCSWQFILQEFSHLRFQWLMGWTFCPFPGKSLAWSSTPPAIFLEGLSSHFIFI